MDGGSLSCKFQSSHNLFHGPAAICHRCRSATHLFCVFLFPSHFNFFLIHISFNTLLFGSEFLFFFLNVLDRTHHVFFYGITSSRSAFPIEDVLFQVYAAKLGDI